MYQGTKELKNGSSLLHGNTDFRIVSMNRDLEVSLQVGTKKAQTASVAAGMKEYIFRNVNVDGNVTISFTDVTPESTENEFAVTVENQVASSDAALTVAYVDDSGETPVPVNIVSGKKYEKGLMIGARVLNNSAKKLVLTAYGAGNRTIERIVIDPMTGSDPAAGGTYVTLNQAIRFVLSYEGGGQEEKPSESEKPSVSESEEPSSESEESSFRE